MKLRILSVLLLLLVTGSVYGQTKYTIEYEQKYEVHVDDSVKTDNDYYVVMVTAEYCGPCQSFKRSGGFDRIKKKLLRSVELDITHRSDLNERIPAFYLCKVSDQTVVRKWVGPTHIEVIEAEINSRSKVKPSVKRLVKTTQRDLERLHDKLHNQASGLNTTWSWPGDLKYHLETVHNVTLD